MMVQINFIKQNENAKIPVYSSDEAAGADLHSVEYVVVEPMKNYLVDTGLDCDIPMGYEMQVRPRSGLAYKHMVTVLNTPGTIDSDYTGRIRVNIMNFSDKPFTIHIGDRIAQLIVSPVLRGVFNWVEEKRYTERGDKGFGSTGV